MFGSRITDAIEYYARKGHERGAVRAVRRWDPDKFRWRRAVDVLSSAAGARGGVERARLEEPVREVIIDLDDYALRREIVLDARRYNVDFDRGEILPERTAGDLRRVTFLTGTSTEEIRKYLPITDDFSAPIDTAGVVVVTRCLAEHHRRRARRVSLELPERSMPANTMVNKLRTMADRDAEAARRWRAVADTLLGELPD